MTAADIGLAGRIALGLATGAALVFLLAAWPKLDASGLPPDFAAACDTDNPYLVTACYPLPGGSVYRAPSVIAFRDTPAQDRHETLATHGQVGAVYGLAYSGAEHAVYAASFHKRQVALGPGGPGAIYRIDLSTRTVSLWTDVPDAGRDRHGGSMASGDVLAEKHAGKTSLGDIDLSAYGDQLFVTNLFSRHIYRYQVPSGALLDRFAHGADGEAWSDDARPFGLAVRGDRLFHAVVRSAESTRREADLFTHVYSSRLDGSDMREVSVFALAYDRGLVGGPGSLRSAPLDWLPWTDRVRSLLPNGYWGRVFPMPEASDIVFDQQGNIIVGMRDRLLDMSTLPGGTVTDYGAGAGDILRGVPDAGRWSVTTSPEHFVDDSSVADENTMGALAALPWLDQIVTNGAGGYRDASNLGLPGVFWFDGPSGGRVRHERVCRSTGGQNPAPRIRAVIDASIAHADNELPPGSGVVGDVEVLCGDDDLPTPTATVTAVPTSRPSATASPRPTSSATASAEPSPTSTAIPTQTAVPSHLYLPIALREHCDPEYNRSDIALVIDTSSSMTGQKIVDAKDAALQFAGMIGLAPGGSQVAVVRYDREAEVVRELTRSRTLIDAAIRSLQVRSGTHIDKGLRAALGELQSPRHLDRNTPVMILLTDGLQTGTPGEELRAAQEVRDAGTLLYTIGLGSDVDEEALKTMAGDEDRYYFAPDSGDLASIYGEIAQDLMCPGKQLWGGRW